MWDLPLHFKRLHFTISRYLNAEVFNDNCKLIFFGSSGRAVQGVGLRPLACWDCGFESHREHGCPYVVSVVCCRVEVSATG